MRYDLVLYLAIMTVIGIKKSELDTPCLIIEREALHLMDVEYRNIESREAPLFNTFKPAMTLLSTVISSNQPDHVTLDAGTKALYVSHCKPLRLSHPDLHYDWGGFGDEHGKITVVNNAILPSNGTVIEMIIPHCDPTINLFDQFLSCASWVTWLDSCGSRQFAHARKITSHLQTG